jgi:hypothetical protein
VEQIRLQCGKIANNSNRGIFGGIYDLRPNFTGSSVGRQENGPYRLFYG